MDEGPGVIALLKKLLPPYTAKELARAVRNLVLRRVVWSRGFIAPSGGGWWWWRRCCQKQFGEKDELPRLRGDVCGRSDGGGVGSGEVGEGRCSGREMPFAVGSWRWSVGARVVSSFQ